MTARRLRPHREPSTRVFLGGEWRPVPTPEEIARGRRDAYWRGLMVGVALGIPATVTATWLVTGVKLLFWWL